MKRIILLLAALLICGSTGTAHGQINFRGISFKEALDAAKKENKLVFMDCYTSWCGPCKYMEAKILSHADVFPFMHEKFVCVKFDMEKGEGMELGTKFNVAAYPTYLILSPDGEQVYRMVGGTETPEEFLEKINEGLKPENSSVNVRERYEAGERDIDLQLTYIDLLAELGDFDKADEVSKGLLNMLTDKEKTSKEIWPLYEHPALSGFGTENFDYILLNRSKFEETAGKEAVDRKIFAEISQKLIDIFVGREKTPSLAEAQSIADYIAENDLPKKEILSDYAAMAIAKITGDREKMLVLLEKLAPGWDDMEQCSMFFSLALIIKKGASKEQTARLIKLSQYLLDKSEYTPFIMSMELFIPYELEEKHGKR